MSIKIRWNGFKDHEPSRKHVEKKRKIITLIIALPLLFLAERFLFNIPFRQYWMIITFGYIAFFVAPFVIGIWVDVHLWNKVRISAAIPLFCVVVLLVIWRTTGGNKLEEVREILVTTGLILIIVSLLTILGDAIQRGFINTK